MMTGRSARWQPRPDAGDGARLVGRHRGAHLRHRRDDASWRVADGRSRRRRPAQRDGHRHRVRGWKGAPQWAKPASFRWDYALFGKPNATPASPDETIEITVVKRNAAEHGFNLWTLNGEAFSREAMKPNYTVRQGRRYRVKFRNASDDVHPLHLHRHSFELTRIAGKATAGVIKDVVIFCGWDRGIRTRVAPHPKPSRVAPGVAAHDVARAGMSHQSSPDPGSARGVWSSGRR